MEVIAYSLVLENVFQEHEVRSIRSAEACAALS